MNTLYRLDLPAFSFKSEFVHSDVGLFKLLSLDTVEVCGGICPRLQSPSYCLKNVPPILPTGAFYVGGPHRCLDTTVHLIGGVSPCSEHLRLFTKNMGLALLCQTLPAPIDTINPTKLSRNTLALYREPLGTCPAVSRYVLESTSLVSAVTDVLATILTCVVIDFCKDIKASASLPMTLRTFR